ncbi:MAG: carbon-nitrogen hydrolase family protein [bacterium]|nr:carbon-nitrogen hydrolase family protein [bacterium]
MIDNQQQSFRIGLIQMCSGRQTSDNLSEAARLIREAAACGATYIQTPENTALLESDPKIIQREAQDFDDSSILTMFQGLACELQVCLHIGSLTIRLEGENKLVNRSCLISSHGNILAHYDKIHMFDVDLARGESYRESKYYIAGKKSIVTDLPVGLMPAPKLGFSICYDLRFAALYRALAKAGAQLIGVPAAFTKQTGKAHWHILLRARAIETGSFILAAAQGGAHENGRSTYGHSLVVSPWGDVIAQADGTEPQIIIADIDLSKVAIARASIPALTHDRPFEMNDPSPVLDRENTK